MSTRVHRHVSIDAKTVRAPSSEIKVARRCGVCLGPDRAGARRGEIPPGAGSCARRSPGRRHRRRRGQPAVTAATGMDALTHCIEAYANRFAHPLIDLYALQGIRLIAQSLEQAVTHGNDLAARTNVALGSMYGGMCLGPVNTGAVHA